MDRVLIIDDDRELCALVQRSLVAAGVDADCCHSGQSGLLHMEGRDYQLVILDVMMPGFDGFDTLEKIRARSCVPVLMLTAKGDGASKVRGLRAGADDYLPKPFAMKELLARVRALCKRRSGYSDADLSFGDIRLRADTFELACENTVRLSAKELELMQLLIRNADHPLASEFVLGRIWEDDRSATGETLALYVSYLRAKLKAVASTLAVMVNDEGGIRLVAREVAVR